MVRQNNNARLAPRPARSVLALSMLSLLAMVVFLSIANAAHAAQVTLAWDPSTQPEVTAYKIYWGTSSGNYPNSVNAGNITTYTVTGLNSGTTYYFAATCSTSTGAESGYSNQVSTTTPSVNSPPVASNGTLTILRNTTGSGILAATDADGNSLIYSIVTAPGKGTLTITNAASGAYTYTANANATGADSFTFRAYDGTAYSNNATVAISITASNTAPVASNGSLNVSGTNPASGKLVATDADGNALTYSIASGPSNGKVTITNATTGAYTYTANSTTSATDSFSFRAYDGIVYSNTATVAISITAPASTPVDNRTRSTLSVAPGWFIEDTGDFNGDGKMDIFWRNTATGQNVIWYMNGAEFLGSESLPAVSDPNWRMVGKGDFNGDGKLDILWRNSADGGNVVWYLDGAQFLGAKYLFTVPDASWTVVGTGDFNADGKTDILWRNTSTGVNVVWYMDGVHFLSAKYLFTVHDQSWTIVGTGDFNADGKIDILWRNTSTGVNVVWYLDGAQFFSAAYLFTVSDQSWTIVGTGDYNTDGKVDILWRNTATGTNAIWYMDLAQFIGAENLFAFNEPA